MSSANDYSSMWPALAEETPRTKDEALLDVLSPSSQALALVPRKHAFAAKLLPLSLTGRVLVCAGFDPIDVRKVAQFSSDVGREVQIVRARKEHVMQALDLAYRDAPCAEADDLVSAVTAKNQKSHLTPRTYTSEPAVTTGKLHTIAITSGKGGVGKSSLTANLGICLASHSLRTILLDCDFGLANLHVMLGVRPERTFADVVRGKLRLHEAAIDALGGVQLVGGGSGASDLASMDYDELVLRGAGFETLQSRYDYLLVDTAAGIHEGVISLLEAAERVVLVVTPDPTSVHDAYVTVRVLFDRKPSVRLGVVVNQAKDESSAKLLFAKFQTFLSLYLDANAEYLGAVRSDPAAAQAPRTRVPVCLASPGSAAARDIDAIARRMAKLPAAAQPRGRWLERVRLRR